MFEEKFKKIDPKSGHPGNPRTNAKENAQKKTLYLVTLCVF